jgi:hypothetical protein
MKVCFCGTGKEYLNIIQKTFKLIARELDDGRGMDISNYLT